MAVIGRNNRTGLQVWSAEWGYPGDFDYREFHKKDGISGMQYWRVSGAGVNLGDKDAYHPDWAAGKVGEHSAISLPWSPSCSRVITRTAVRPGSSPQTMTLNCWATGGSKA